MEVTIISGIVTLIGIIVTNLLQYISNKKKTNADILNQMLEQALKLNKQELETIRELNKDLELKLDKLEARLELREAEIDKLKDRVGVLEDEKEGLQRQLDKCMKKKD